MKGKIILLMFALTSITALQAQTAPAPAVVADAPDHGQQLTLKVWDNTSAPHSNGLTTPEQYPAPGRVANITEAVLYLYPADPQRATGQSLLLCPGGGYIRIAMEHEGFAMARWLAANGITVGVLKYRMPNGHSEVPLEDAEQALRIMKGEVPGAEAYVTRQVGVAGCSAGGHLAASLSTMGRPAPDFSVLFYPVITGEAGKCHKGSFDNLLGSGRSEAETAEWSLQNRVTAQTPPALLLLSDDDRSVPPISSISYYAALKEQGIRASMHIFPSGGHGWGMNEGFRYREAWQQALLDWLKTIR